MRPVVWTCLLVTSGSGSQPPSGAATLPAWQHNMIAAYFFPILAAPARACVQDPKTEDSGNVFYYDETLKQWRERGAPPPPAPVEVAPPPMVSRPAGEHWSWPPAPLHLVVSITINALWLCAWDMVHPDAAACGSVDLPASVLLHSSLHKGRQLSCMAVPGCCWMLYSNRDSRGACEVHQDCGLRTRCSREPTHRHLESEHRERTQQKGLGRH